MSIEELLLEIGYDGRHTCSRCSCFTEINHLVGGGCRATEQGVGGGEEGGHGGGGGGGGRAQGLLQPGQLAAHSRLVPGDPLLTPQNLLPGVGDPGGCDVLTGGGRGRGGRGEGELRDDDVM